MTCHIWSWSECKSVPVLSWEQTCKTANCSGQGSAGKGGWYVVMCYTVCLSKACWNSQVPVYTNLGRTPGKHTLTFSSVHCIPNQMSRSCLLVVLGCVSGRYRCTINGNATASPLLPPSAFIGSWLWCYSPFKLPCKSVPHQTMTCNWKITRDVLSKIIQK